MIPKEQAELEELNITAEQLAARTQEMEQLAAGESQPINATLPLGAARIAGDNATEQKTRKTRSDAGKERGPRIYVDAPGVRFDLMHVEGRASFKYWISRTFQEGGAMFGNAAIDELLAHIDRLVAK